MYILLFFDDCTSNACHLKCEHFVVLVDEVDAEKVQNQTADDVIGKGSLW
jgi:hypothetical protein